MQDRQQVSHRTGVGQGIGQSGHVLGHDAGQVI